SEFSMPDGTQIVAMQGLLDSEHFRSIIICPRDVFLIECSSAFGLNWRVRLADGYLSGISKRLASLPWFTPTVSTPGNPSPTVGPRSISFGDLRAATWKVLSFLNVRNAVLMTP